LDAVAIIDHLGQNAVQKLDGQGVNAAIPSFAS
jgi:hypothetical protein